MDVDKDKVVEEIPDIMVLMVIIDQILRKKKVSLHHQKWNNMKWNNTEAKQENGKRLQDKPPKNHGIIVIDVVRRGIGHVPIVRPNIWSTFTKHQ